ncbi:MAG: metallophosphoesterase family protein [Candidatus Hydrogenedentes bacterium]|nr:metallophosphoesterase family protein [Candidatus Hydrogenedentota bacterium]
MRYAVISDIHANLEALVAVLDEVDRAGVDRIVCLGDVVGYNACPNECADLIRGREVLTILGNHDAVACGLEEPWGFHAAAEIAAMWTRQQLSAANAEWLRALPLSEDLDDFLAVHAAPGSQEWDYIIRWEDALPFVPRVERDGHTLCFFGHTHTPGIFASDGMYSLDEDSTFALDDGKVFLINPGSVGQPRDGDPRAAFGILDMERREYRLSRVEYPVREAANRIVEQGLPRPLAERLPLGH